MPFLLLLVALLGTPAQRAVDVVKWSASVSAPVAPGGVAKITATAAVQPGWKLYAVEQPEGGPEPLTFAVGKTAPFRIAAKQIRAPKPRTQDDDNFGTATRYYEDEAVFTIPVAVLRSVQPGTQTVPLDITFQACGGSICLRPFTQRIDIPLSVSR